MKKDKELQNIFYSLEEL